MSEKAVILPERVWGRLASAADHRGVTVADLLTVAVEGLIATKRRDSRERLLSEIRAGVPDPVVAHRLGVPVEAVRRERRALGMRAPKFDRRAWPELMPQWALGSGEGKQHE